jgi:hypothetical protein
MILLLEKGADLFAAGFGINPSDYCEGILDPEVAGLLA